MKEEGKRGISLSSEMALAASSDVNRSFSLLTQTCPLHEMENSKQAIFGSQPALISIIYTLLFSFPLHSLARGSCALPPNPLCKKIETLDAKLSSFFVFFSGLFFISMEVLLISIN